MFFLECHAIHFASHAGNIFGCLSAVVGVKVKPSPVTPKMGVPFAVVAFPGGGGG